jgi:peptidoglycan/LPS O-acetylase OafA/YrhL
VLFALIPPLFCLTKNSTIDRFVGEFSYPVYLWHIAIGSYFIPAQQYWQGYLLLLLSVITSIPLVMVIERPMERWRKTSLQRVRLKDPDSAIPANVPASDKKQEALADAAE